MSDPAFYSLEAPLDTMPVERQMRTANLSGFVELVRGMGADPAAILDRHGLALNTIRDPDAYIDSKALVDVLEDCGAVFNDPLFGLRLAQLQEPDVYGCIAALCRAAPNVRDAIRNFVDYIPVIHSPVTVLELAEGRDTAELRWHVKTDLGLNQQANFQGTMLNVKLLKLLGGRSFRPSYVSLAGDVRSKDVPEIEQRLGCQVRSRAAVNAIAFPTMALDQPVPSANRLLFKLIGGYLDRVRSTSPGKSMVERVEDYVRGSLASGSCSIENCATRFGVSVRTLQVQLSGAGLRFSDILEKQRLALARSYLGQACLSLDDVAVMLGYSEQTAFGRAFKRWTGSTPQRYREQSHP